MIRAVTERSRIARFGLLALLVPLGILPVGGCSERADTALTFGLDPAEHEPYFPIAVGKHALASDAADGPIACSSCHTNERASFEDFSCVGCHEHRRDATDALHGGMAAYRYESPRCLTCHPRGEASLELGDDAHTELYFPIDDTSAHAAVTCASCHVSEGDRSVVSCTSCHDHDAAPLQITHGQMTGYLWETARCMDCHERSQNPGDYEHTGFPTAPDTAHEEVSCKECHATPQDRAQMLCVTCHEHEEPEMAEQHDGVPEYLYESGSCLMCHREAQVPGTLAHTFFPIDPPATHALGVLVDNQGATPNETLSCASCHTDDTTREAVACTRCHVHSEAVLAPTHTPIPGYLWQDASCLFCHPNGEPTGLINHTAFPIAAGTPHEPVACTSCHANAQNRSLLLCTTCHEHRLEVTEPVHHGMPGFSFDSAACFTCHQQAQVPGTFDHEPLFPLLAPSGAGEHQALSCADCHANPAQRSAVSCTSCHITLPAETDEVHSQPRLATSHDGINGYVWSPASCVGCHPNGTAEGAVFAHPYFPIAAGNTHEVGGGANNLTCTDCHIDDLDYTVLGCTGCHLGSHDQAPMQTRHANVTGFAWESAQCLFCHPNGEPAGNIDHESSFPIAAPAAHVGIACADCHTNPDDRSVLGCAQCHANDTPTVAAVHTGIPGFSNNSPACLQCHPRAEPSGTMEHASFFPIAAGTTHTGQLCTECHQSRTDRAQNLCAQCHQSETPGLATSHSLVGDFANSSPDCKLCHAESQVDRKAAHLPFKISTGGIEAHRNAECRECHAQNRTDKTWARNFGVWSCVECHGITQTNNDHDEQNGYISYDNPRCTTCHPDGRK